MAGEIWKVLESCEGLWVALDREGGVALRAGSLSQLLEDRALDRRAHTILYAAREGEPVRS